MINTLTIIGENKSQVKSFACCMRYNKTMDKIYLPDFKATIRLTDNRWDNVQFTLELSEGIPYSAKEFLKLQFAIWAKKELLGKLYEFCIYSKDKQNITVIKFKVNLWDEILL